VAAAGRQRPQRSDAPRRRRHRSEQPGDLGQDPAERALPLRLGQEIQALPRAHRLSGGRLLVCINRNASRAARSVGPALATLVNAGFDLVIRQPEGAAALDRLIRAEGAQADAIVIAGGDGTMNAAIDALIAVRRPVGLLPFGTANDLAATLGLPLAPAAAAGVIAAGRLRPIDIGRVNGISFVNVASIGLSVSVARRQSRELKEQWRAFSYVIASAGALQEAERFDAVVHCGGRRTSVLAYQIAIGNGVHYGGGMKIAADAAIDDGFFDVYAIETGSVAELIRIAPLLRLGIQAPGIRVFRGRSVVVETAAPMPVNTDGEISTETPAEFVMERRALKMLVP
jgi:YegS/Rv2252/BmrU family lipid kinase